MSVGVLEQPRFHLLASDHFSTVEDVRKGCFCVSEEGFPIIDHAGPSPDDCHRAFGSLIIHGMVAASGQETHTVH